jgi:hypothetical protein
VKSNKKDCQRLASRGTKIVGDIWRQTKDFGVDLPTEARESVEEIEGSVSFEQNSRTQRHIDICHGRIIRNIVDLMKELKKQNIIRRYAHQDESKSRIEEQGKLLDEAEKRFDVSFADVLDA